LSTGPWWKGYDNSSSNTNNKNVYLVDTWLVPKVSIHQIGHLQDCLTIESCLLYTRSNFREPNKSDICQICIFLYPKNSYAELNTDFLGFTEYQESTGSKKNALMHGAVLYGSFEI